MGFHFVPLVAGVAIGAVSTYLYKDEKTRSAILDRIPKFGKEEQAVSAKAAPAKKVTKSTPAKRPAKTTKTRTTKTVKPAVKPQPKLSEN